MSPLDPGLTAQIRAWINDDPDARTAAELTTLLTSAEAGDFTAATDLTGRFSGMLQFGTAGLRGELGGGPARMNRAVVSRAAAGLAAFLREQIPATVPRVVIGFDARYGSQQFAHDSAEIIAGAGGQVLLCREHTPTPVLAYAVRDLDADLGIMVTASHNPAQDNGYKVYLGGRVVTDAGQGAQIVDPVDTQIAAHIAAVESVSGLPRSSEFDFLGPELEERYIAHTAGLVNPAENPLPSLKIVCTPMHGVGGEILGRVLTEAGFTDLTFVAEQQRPDPNFPTVDFPNPEEPGALDLAVTTAERVGADLIIANDPDADRVSIAVPQEGSWHQLSGDEVGVLLGEGIAGQLRSRSDAMFATSIVSSRLLGQIAAHHGIAHQVTLTGFKWISRVPGLTYGYEEALGYCVDPAAVRDKDGISAALLLAFLVARAIATGRTVADLIDDLALRHGLYATGQLAVRVEDMADIPAAMARLRQSPPTHLAGSAVTETVDLAANSGDLPPTDGLIYVTAANSRVIVRPSGTEPKIKCYLEIVIPVTDRAELTEARRQAAAGLDELRRDIAAAAGI